MLAQEGTDLIKKRPKETTKIYKRRWIILTIFILYSAANTFQWMEYSIMTNIVKRFYNVSSLAVNWTSIIYMAIYPLIVLPVSYLIDKKGLRVAALIGGLGTFLAAAVKVFSIRTYLFWVVLLGQAIGSTSQVFILCLPAKIAAVWFKPSEVSIACALAFFGIQLGFAFGFVFPTTIVKNHDEIMMIESNLRQLCWGLALYMLPVAVMIIFYFQRLPPLPPTIAQLEDRKKSPLSFGEFLKEVLKILRKNGFICHLLAFGINVGVYSSIGTYLNQFVLYYFPNSEEDAGRMGLLIVVSGMVGSILFGLYLDKSHRYKETTMFIYYMSAVSVAAFLGALKYKGKILTYITAGMLGFFSNSYMPVGFEFAVELTFPSDESTTTGLMNAMTQAFGVFITLGMGQLNESYGPVWTLTSQIFLLAIGAILTQKVPNEKRRHEAFCKDKKEEMVLSDGV